MVNLGPCRSEFPGQPRSVGRRLRGHESGERQETVVFGGRDVVFGVGSLAIAVSAHASEV